MEMIVDNGNNNRNNGGNQGINDKLANKHTMASVSLGAPLV